MKKPEKAKDEMRSEYQREDLDPLTRGKYAGIYPGLCLVRVNPCNPRRISVLQSLPDHAHRDGREQHRDDLRDRAHAGRTDFPPQPCTVVQREHHQGEIRRQCHQNDDQSDALRLREHQQRGDRGRPGDERHPERHNPKVGVAAVHFLENRGNTSYLDELSGLAESLDGET